MRASGFYWEARIADCTWKPLARKGGYLRARQDSSGAQVHKVVAGQFPLAQSQAGCHARPTVCWSTRSLGHSPQLVHSLAQLSAND